MLPPLFLTPLKSDFILDMCASPGSKTLHLLEMLHQGEGCIVANEANINRINMLVNHVGCIPSDRIAITHHLAQDFPLHSLPQRFDRVLCDVPCSGDGTLVRTFASFLVEEKSRVVDLLESSLFLPASSSTVQYSKTWSAVLESGREASLQHLFLEPNRRRGRCCCSSSTVGF